jgi:hypothetical protein
MSAGQWSLAVAHNIDPIAARPRLLSLSTGTILRSTSRHERKIAGVNSDRAFAEPAPLNWAAAILMAAAPKKRRPPRSTSSYMDRSPSKFNLSQPAARTTSFSRSLERSCSSLLRKRPQFGDDDRQIFRDRRMNVHGALDDRVRRLRIHDV